MKTNCLLIVLAGCLSLFVSCGKKDASKTQTSSSGNPVTAPVDYLGAVVRAKQTAQKTVGIVGLQQTIQMFQAQEGRLPKNLNELVGPNYLSSLPDPPLNSKFDYNPATGEVKVVPK
jgi:hypothetical protein